MSRAVSATIGSPVSTPREGLRVDFHAEPPNASTSAVTDAGGVFVAQLEPGVPYMVPVNNAVIVNGQPFPAGTVFRVIVPEGEGPADISEVTVEIIDASQPALLAWLNVLDATVTAYETRLQALDATSAEQESRQQALESTIAALDARLQALETPVTPPVEPEVE
jgi:hypothetical protein